MEQSVDMVMLNGNFMTNETGQDVHTAIAISNSRIVAVGDGKDIQSFISGRTRVIDCKQFLVIPGFIDAHMHPFSIARNTTSVNCAHNNTNSVTGLVDLLRVKASETRLNEWILGHGYDEALVEPPQKLDRSELDLVSCDHPIKLTDRSGHITVLNSKAMELANINAETLDPMSGIIFRYDGSTTPSGVFLDCERFLKDRLGHTLDHRVFRDAMHNTNEHLIKYGITSVQDASYTNGQSHWDTYVDLIESGVWQLKTTMMVGIDSIEQFKTKGMTFGSCHDRLRLGHTKIILGSTTGRLSPSQDELHYQVQTSHDLGFPVAIHAVEWQAVQAAAEVLGVLHDETSISRHDRIEHCSEAPSAIIGTIARSQAMVVTQPGFLYWRHQRYKETVPEDMQPYIYPIPKFAENNIPYAFSSDAPVIDPNPWCGIDAILNGRPPFYRGTLPTDAPLLSRLKAAIYPYTLGAAYSDNTHMEKGSITIGKKADLAMFPWSPGPHLPPPESNYAILTVIDGVVVHDDLPE